MALGDLLRFKGWIESLEEDDGPPCTGVRSGRPPGFQGRYGLVFRSSFSLPKKSTAGHNRPKGEDKASWKASLDEMFAADEMWRSGGISLGRGKRAHSPRHLWENERHGMHLDLDWKKVFSWKRLRSLEDPYLNFTIEHPPFYGPVESEYATRFFIIENRDKYFFPNESKASPFFNWKLPSLRFVPNQDPFGWNSYSKAIVEETRLSAWHEIKTLVDGIMEAGAKLRCGEENLLPVPMPAKQNESARRFPRGEPPVKFLVDEDPKELLRAVIKEWNRKGMDHPERAVMLTISSRTASILNRLAQNERRDEGLVGRD